MAVKLVVAAVLIFGGYLIGYADAMSKYKEKHRVFRSEYRQLCPKCKQELYWDSRKGYQQFEHCHRCGAALDHKKE